MVRTLDVGAGSVLAVATVQLFREPLASMVRQWDASPMYSYGYAVPVISSYLLWVQKDRFRQLLIEPSRLGGAVVIGAAISMLAIGRVIAVQLLEQLSFIVAIAGIAMFLLGRTHVRLAAAAILYLLFMVPMWDVVTEPLHWPFQLQSARLGVAMMQGIGIPVYREDTFITLPNLSLEVARECSGVNYLIAVLALALPMAFLRLRQTWRRVALIASSLVVAALANSLRVALIGTLAYYDVGSPLHGPFHVLHGLFVAAIGFVVIFAGLQVLDEGLAIETPAASARTGPRTTWRRRDAFGLAAVFAAIAFVGVAPQAQQVALAQPLEAVPLQLGDWTAKARWYADEGTSPTKAAWGRADLFLDRDYESPDGRRVRIELFYFAAQRQNHEIISSASSDLHRLATRIDVDGNETAFSANLLEWPDRRETALFWYESDGRSEAGEMATKLATIRRSLLTGRNNGAAIVLRTRSSKDAATTLKEFSRHLRPALISLWTANGEAPRNQP